MKNADIEQRAQASDVWALHVDSRDRCTEHGLLAIRVRVLYKDDHRSLSKCKALIRSGAQDVPATLAERAGLPEGKRCLKRVFGICICGMVGISRLGISGMDDIEDAEKIPRLVNMNPDKSLEALP